jgi:hypothetical protein
MKADQVADPHNLEHPPIQPELVRNQVERLLSHPLFQNSKRYSSFVKFIVSHTLSGEHDSLKERIIGIEVFGRPASFETSMDSIVRVTATEVRRRLTLYYSEAEHEQELRIELPTRSYIAEFTLPPPPKEASAAPPEPKQSPRLSLWLTMALLCLCLLSFAAYRLLARPTTIDRFWAPMLNYQGTIPISVGTLTTQNSGLQIPETKLPMLTSGLTISGYLPSQLVFAARGDLTAAIAAAAFLGHDNKVCELQIAQNATLEDMKHQPVFIIGSMNNEWAVRLGYNLRYHFQSSEDTNVRWIEDTANPANRNWLVDRLAPYDRDRKEYAVITRALNLSTGQWWIGVAGLTGLGTSVAQQSIMDPKLMSALGERLPKDWDKKNLQVILEVNIVKESPGTPQVVAVYSW